MSRIIPQEDLDKLEVARVELAKATFGQVSPKIQFDIQKLTEEVWKLTHKNYQHWMEI